MTAMRKLHIRVSTPFVVLALVAGCGDDDDAKRSETSRPPQEGPPSQTETTERPTAPAVPDGGLDRGHGVDDP